jgi:DNA-binding MarR family transcriptional regulator
MAAPHRHRIAAAIRRIDGLDYGPLDGLLGFAVRRAQVTMFLSFHKAAHGLGVSPPRFTALVMVGANPGMSQSTLGKVLGIARSGAMMLTDDLEARGLIERRRHEDDARVWGLYLTARGRRFTEALRRRVAAEDRKQAAVLTAAERGALARLLNKLAG